LGTVVRVETVLEAEQGRQTVAQIFRPLEAQTATTGGAVVSDLLVLGPVGLANDSSTRP
jgi:hypothetical protein